MLAAIARRQACPDISYLYGSWAANIATQPDRRSTCPPGSRSRAWNWNDFWPAGAQAVQVNGKMIGMPALVDNLALVYNKKLFDQAGIPLPDRELDVGRLPGTRREADRSVGQKQFGWAYVNDGSEDTVWRFDAMLWQAGGDDPQLRQHEGGSSTHRPG